MKYNLSSIMRRAWVIFRKAATKAAITFGEALHRAWQVAKAEPINAKRVDDARRAAGITEAVNTWAGWRDLGFEVAHGSKAIFQTMRYRYEKFKVNVLNCCSYRTLSEVIQGFKFDKADRSILSSDLFAKCFVESGAYYTLKQMVMFEGLSLDGRDVCENLDNLKKRGQFGYMSLYRSLRV